MRHNPDFVARLVSNELVLVPISRSAADFEGIFTLNEVGARIWALIGEGHSADEIAQQLSTEYDVTPETAAQDVAELIAQLVEINAVVSDGSVSAGPGGGA